MTVFSGNLKSALHILGWMNWCFSLCPSSFSILSYCRQQVWCVWTGTTLSAREVLQIHHFWTTEYAWAELHVQVALNSKADLFSIVCARRAAELRYLRTVLLSVLVKDFFSEKSLFSMWSFFQMNGFAQEHESVSHENLLANRDFPFFCNGFVGIT